jgi:hypothetical protein
MTRILLSNLEGVPKLSDEYSSLIKSDNFNC